MTEGGNHSIRIKIVKKTHNSTEVAQRAGKERKRRCIVKSFFQSKKRELSNVPDAEIFVGIRSTFPIDIRIST